MSLDKASSRLKNWVYVKLWGPQSCSFRFGHPSKKHVIPIGPCFWSFILISGALLKQLASCFLFLVTTKTSPCSEQSYLRHSSELPFFWPPRERSGEFLLEDVSRGDIRTLVVPTELRRPLAQPKVIASSCTPNLLLLRHSFAYRH